MSPSPQSIVRFGLFEANLATGELWKKGRKVNLQGLPFQLLSILLRRAGHLVNREEIRNALWPNDAHGEFAEGVNTAIRKVRQALDDDAHNSRFIETLPRKGYRFIAPLMRDVQEREAVPSVAVLPFGNPGAGESQQIFSDGLTEDLINTLARVAGLKVTGRTSSFAFKDKHEDVRRIGEILGVAHVVEGSMRQFGDRIRVNVQLVRVSDGTPLWSERFDRELTHVFAIQDEISKAIAEALQVTLAVKNAQTPHPTGREAYHALLEGRHYLGRPSPENLVRGQKAFERGIRLDGGLARGHAGLAEALVFQAYQRMIPHSQVWEHAERAIVLDPNCAEARIVRAQLRGIFEYDWAAAGRDFQEAVRLNPSSTDAWDRYGVLYLRILGRFEEALAAHQRAFDLDPLAPIPRTNTAFTLHLMGRNEEAMECIETTLELFPDSPLVQHHACMIYDAAGMVDKARALAMRGIGSPNMLGLSSLANLARNASDGADALQALEAHALHEPVVPGMFVLPWAATGDMQRAIEWAARAIDEHDAHFLVEFRAPCFAALRADARFLRILKRADLEIKRDPQ